METQTRFDLDTAIANWQTELNAQPDLTPIVRRELETHLRDTVAELQKRGLNNEESFWLARRRTGQPQQLNEEFVKADPNSVWQDRAFWMVTFLLVMNLWSAVCLPLQVYRTSHSNQVQNLMSDWMLRHSPFWLRTMPLSGIFQVLSVIMHFVPLVVLFFFIRNKRQNFVKTAFSFVAVSRTRFVVSALILFFITNLINRFGTSPIFLIAQFLWVGPLIVLGAWLMRPEERITPKTV